MFAATGSTITAAIASGCVRNWRSTAGRSLKGASRDNAAMACGTPGEAAMPKVAKPEPAFERKLSL